MEQKRAEEIMESNGYIEVTLNDRAVWIEDINRDGKAQVKDMKTNEIREVSFSELHETDDLDSPGG